MSDFNQKNHSPPERVLTSSTSCTKDQAVALLLGRSIEPIEFSPSSEFPTDDEWANILEYSLADDMDEQLEELRVEYDLAKEQGYSKEVIASKKNAIDKYKEQIKIAHTYFCRIDDELAKGEASILRIDPYASNAAGQRITLVSLKEWAFKKFALDILPNVLSSVSKTRQGKTHESTRTKQLEQEDVILNKIRQLGHDPSLLPKNIPGKAGVKAQVRKNLEEHPLFQGETIFDKAWERLVDGNRIEYAANPPPNKSTGDTCEGG